MLRCQIYRLRGYQRYVADLLRLCTLSFDFVQRLLEGQLPTPRKRSGRPHRPKSQKRTRCPSIESNFHALQSLIHGLCEKTTLTITEAIEIVERALEVQLEKADLDGVQAPSRQALDHLASIAASLRVDED